MMVPGGENLVDLRLKEAKYPILLFWWRRNCCQKGYSAKSGFFWAANQPGFSPKAIHIHHPTELMCFKFWLGVQPTSYILGVVGMRQRARLFFWPPRYTFHHPWYNRLGSVLFQALRIDKGNERLDSFPNYTGC